jgi:hypothetical protein
LIINWTDPTVQATIAFMSASDAAPLPRLGEVFFDVRGDSRSMRLSWYADTDVAVFSIWQGGMCTGTFRLPMGDLSRMVEILQRGPDGRHGRGSGRDAGVHDVGQHGVGQHGVGQHGVSQQAGPGYTGSGYDADYEADYNGEYDADYAVAHNAPAQHGPVDEADSSSGTYGRGGAHSPGDYGAADYGSGDYGSSDYRSGDYGAGDYGHGDHAEPRYGETGNRDGGSRAGGHRAGGHRAGDHGAERYGGNFGPPDLEQAAHAPRPGYWHEDNRYQADMTGQGSVQADEAGYGQQRFAPPYVHPQPDSSDTGFFDESEYRRPADRAARSRHSAGGYGRGQEQ